MKFSPVRPLACQGAGLAYGPRRAGVAERVSGFTLIELIVALALFSLLAWTAYAGLRVGARTWEAGNERAERLSDMRVALSFVDRYLANALPIAERAQGRWHVDFDGEADRLVFLTEMGANLGVGGIYRMTLAVDEARDAKRLVMRRVLLGANASELGAADPQEVSAYLTDRVLADGLEAVSFEYFGQEDDIERTRQAKPQWQESWSGRRSLPLAVRVRIEAVDEMWPELVARLQRDEIQFIKTDGEGGDSQDTLEEELLETLEDGSEQGASAQPAAAESIAVAANSGRGGRV